MSRILTFICALLILCVCCAVDEKKQEKSSAGVGLQQQANGQTSNTSPIPSSNASSLASPQLPSSPSSNTTAAPTGTILTAHGAVVSAPTSSLILRPNFPLVATPSGGIDLLADQGIKSASDATKSYQFAGEITSGRGELESVLCFLGMLGYTDDHVVNHGPYKAKVDNSHCRFAGLLYRENPIAVVDVKRAPMGTLDVKFWVGNFAAVHIEIAEGENAKNPYGIFLLQSIYTPLFYGSDPGISPPTKDLTINPSCGCSKYYAESSRLSPDGPVVMKYTTPNSSFVTSLQFKSGDKTSAATHIAIGRSNPGSYWEAVYRIFYDNDRLLLYSSRAGKPVCQKPGQPNVDASVCSGLSESGELEVPLTNLFQEAFALYEKAPEAQHVLFVNGAYVGP